MATNTEVDENEDREEELLLHVSQEDEQEERSLLEGVERKGDLKDDIAVEEKEIDISSVKYPSHPAAAPPPPPPSTVSGRNIHSCTACTFYCSVSRNMFIMVETL